MCVFEKSLVVGDKNIRISFSSPLLRTLPPQPIALKAQRPQFLLIYALRDELSRLHKQINKQGRRKNCDPLTCPWSLWCVGRGWRRRKLLFVVWIILIFVSLALGFVDGSRLKEGQRGFSLTERSLVELGV